LRRLGGGAQRVLGATGAPQVAPVRPSGGGMAAASGGACLERGLGDPLYAVGRDPKPLGDLPHAGPPRRRQGLPCLLSQVVYKQTKTDSCHHILR
jgi:hypothetical protein